MRIIIFMIIVSISLNAIGIYKEYGKGTYKRVYAEYKKVFSKEELEEMVSLKVQTPESYFLVATAYDYHYNNMKKAKVLHGLEKTKSIDFSKFDKFVKYSYWDFLLRSGKYKRLEKLIEAKEGRKGTLKDRRIYEYYLGMAGWFLTYEPNKHLKRAKNHYPDAKKIYYDWVKKRDILNGTYKQYKTKRKI
jgi:hypothetical protein